MTTIGSLIKEARRKKGLTRIQLSRDTKIKKEFIKALEAHVWQSLPEYPVVVGFVKNLSQELGIDKSQALAFLRRDYPPQKLQINPKPDVGKNEFRWNPRLTFLVGVAAVILTIFGYLGFQYINFIRPPSLTVGAPIEGQEIFESLLVVVGKTEATAAVRVNNQPALVDEHGFFRTEIEVTNETNEIEVSAISRSGKETVKRVTIRPELE